MNVSDISTNTKQRQKKVCVCVRRDKAIKAKSVNN